MVTTSPPVAQKANSDKNNISKRNPSNGSHASLWYLQGCDAIVNAWHHRLSEIKGKVKEDAEDDIKLNKSYATFFRNEISASDAAKLRRCQHMHDVAIQPAFITLWQQIETQLLKRHDFISNNQFAAWLAVTWILAQVHTVDKDFKTLASVAGQTEKDSDRTLITPLRFEKLTAARDPENFTTLLARMVAQLQQQGHALNVICLANDILHWFADYQGVNHRNPRDKLVVQWALDYYQAGK